MQANLTFKDFLRNLNATYSELQDSVSNMKDYGKREAYGFMVYYVKNNTVNNADDLIKAIVNQLDYTKSVTEKPYNVVLNSYIKTLNDFIKALKQISKANELKGCKTSTHKPVTRTVARKTVRKTVRKTKRA